MWDVSSFLLRWMFVSNMCRDVAQIQMLPICYPSGSGSSTGNSNHPATHPPQQPYLSANPHASTSTTTQPASLPHHAAQTESGNDSHSPAPRDHHNTHPSQSSSNILQYPTTAAASSLSSTTTTTSFDNVAQDWKDDCLRGVLSYPPGSMQRVMAMDAMRSNLVQQLTQMVARHQDTLQRYKNQQSATSAATATSATMDELPPQQQQHDKLGLNAATKLQSSLANRADVGGEERTLLQQETIRISQTTSDDAVITGQETTTIVSSHTVSVLDDLVHNISLGDDDEDTTSTEEEDDNMSSTQSSTPREVHTSRRPWSLPTRAATTTEAAPIPPTLEQVKEAKQSLLLLRNYLPQLVSAVLKSPPAFFAHITNPILQLRTLILTCCLRDPSLGIELCWLLEAEVGRAWKALLEHRQETGRRLIVVLPADKAVVLAQIGMEKGEAFDFLQEAEQATAYGYTNPAIVDSGNKGNGILDPSSNTARLPSSLSYRRCSHFGDTMQFIDRLTKISSDLRMVPTMHRYDVLHESLHELNRRIRRRMISRGDITLDMEDHRNAYDWPRIDDMSVDMIQYSVHLPLITQVATWPDGQVQSADSGSSSSSGSDMPNLQVVRVLNLVVSETKILSSRERCPYLVHLEVADSGLEGNDARLYSSGVDGLGSTIGEALGLQSPSSANFFTTASSPLNLNVQSELPTYEIPSELLPQAPPDQWHPQQITNSPDAVEPVNGATEQRLFPRGGYQAEGPMYDYYDGLSDDYATNTFDPARQYQYEQLHQQLHEQWNMAPPAPPTTPTMHTTLSTGNDLLDKVFGRAWLDKCKEIRDASPYGHVKGWRLASFILKAGEDIRREAFVMQIISKLQKWFQSEIPEQHRPFMRPYTIMCVGGDAGLLECLSDAKSVDEVKKRTDGYTTLRDYFERAYGPPRSSLAARMAQQPHGALSSNTWSGQAPVAFGLSKLANGNTAGVTFEAAQDNFLRSLVGYSLVCYILQVKDRHNANILLDRVGHIMHIDFGFVLGETPKMGKVPIFSERAPFKLSGDFWDVLGGWNVKRGGLGVKFCEMFELAFDCAAKHAEEIATLTEAAMLSLDSKNPRAARAIANGVRSRLRMRGPAGSRAQKMFVMELVNAALTCWGTSTYDWLQRNMNGYQ